MTDDHEPLDIDVLDQPDRQRYTVSVNGQPAGRLEYRLRPDRIAFTHAEVEPRWEGHGVGSRLAKAALDDAVGRGLQITPLCPFVVAYLHRHPEYVEHIDDAHRGEFTAEAAGGGAT